MNRRFTDEELLLRSAYDSKPFPNIGMKQLLVFIFLLVLSFSQNGQELVQNGSFENISACPNQLSSSGYYSFVSGNDTLHDFMRLADPWYCPTSGTSDLFNACATSILVGVPLNMFGSAEASEGDGYASIICYHNTADDWENNPIVFDYLEYIQAPLSDALIPGATYKASFKIRRASFCRYAIDQLGMAVHEGPIVADDSIYSNRLELNPVLLTPPNQVVSNSADWQLFESEFIPSAPVDHITIGRFEKPVNLEIEEMTTEIISMVLRRAVYYFDEISIELISIPSNIVLAEEPNLEVIYSIGCLLITSPERGSSPFSIYDAYGKLVHRGLINAHSERIDLQLLPGAYFVESEWGVKRFLAF